MNNKYIKPIQKDKWHGYNGQNAIPKTTVLRALIDSKNHVYNTGLNNVDKIYDHPKEKHKKITEEEYYSYLVGFDLSNIFRMGHPHEFWDGIQGKITLNNYLNIINIDVPINYVKYKVLKASPLVANSIDDYKNDLYPEAIFYIDDEDKKMKIEASKLEKIKKCRNKSNSLTKNQKQDLLLVIENIDSFDKSDEFIELEFEKIINYKYDELFSKLNNLELIKRESLVKQAIDRNIFSRNDQGQYLYFEKFVGNDIHEIVTFLSNEKNQEIELRIFAMLEGK